MSGPVLSLRDSGAPAGPAGETLGGVLVSAAQDHPSTVAVAFPDHRLTVAALLGRADELAAALIGHGIGPGDKVGILMPNSGDYVVALFGIARAGAVAVPINGRFKETEFGHVVRHADLRILLAAPAAGADYARLLGTLGDADRGLLELVVWSGEALSGTVRPDEFLTAAAGVEATEVERRSAGVRPDDVAILMYTSGTTALPKGCLLAHGAIVRHATNIGRERFHLTADDRFWDPLPLFHCGGIVPMVSCIQVGAEYHHAGHFDADTALRVLETERITLAYPAFEAIWLGILNHPRRRSADLSSIRMVMNIATPERLAWYEEQMPWAPQVSSFGSTESASHLTLTEPDEPYEVRMRTTGRPIGGMEMKIVSPESGVEVAEGERGELCFRGYARFLGYYKDPEATARTIDSNGWFHTGDLASVEDGRLIYRGRLKDMLKVGGENVAALEIEDYLVRHPAIAVAQVVAAPDARYGEVPAAFVQLQPGASITQDEVIDFCLDRIATYKIPRYLRIVDEWPMSGTKVRKYELRDRIRQELEDAHITEAPAPRARPTTEGSV
ncbi:AMP-binding protein [Nakamurella sp. YIM 132087]|uniref:AMP-binding protein n=1 Tax=Nakamurella alba TaxID=2665158 RepID=A0A7K1FID4_9ACTN|nr:AMP-binding protein [Nakamurella alba]MTD13858.1 AMP-binding protein [Nakamurella alba]